MGSAICKQEKVIDESLEANKQIELELRKERIAERRTIKVLLLGSADSGKSTIAKQMRILHSGGFNETELINYRYMVLTNMITAYHHLCRGCKSIGVVIKEEDRGIFDLYLNHHLRLFDFADEDMITELTRMRMSDFAKEALNKLNQFYMPDNSKYLFTNASRILNKLYAPTELDVIHARASTTGVHEIGFNFRKYYIRLIDAGGQKTERRKWIHCFENVTAVLFVASLSAFDQFLDEEPSKNALDDSVELFFNMYNNEFLRRCSFILFLNKKDILENKIQHTHFSKYFSNYKGKNRKNNFEEVKDHIKNRFLAAEDEMAEERRHIYLHFTNATDRNNIEIVFGASCDIILQNNLTRAGMS
ncbi:hypothetical protein M3Y97_00187300 [Aphelenchoides bicaudatus]|nr:hypothetical protein M3Y97_00187300 [Aphelenchoides bicaudatus]